ncbi:Sec-independent protein translocase subunit TatA/TatB [Blattabacterium cuenoti]|uniref:Sec-independent protein translocase subunit TatA/TatB n=1 Tax=Blattabacterium cuenoti TaxID=1653831 RepID=UPI00163CD19F|nr:twin-arginine translocase TatA/TatE family subunit [Blattabacterium cuenoti]
MEILIEGFLRKNINFLFISFEESFLIIFIAIIIFGPKKIPHIARGLGEGIRYFREAKNKITEEMMNIRDHNFHQMKKKEKYFNENEKNKKKSLYSSIKRHE